MANRSTTDRHRAAGFSPRHHEDAAVEQRDSPLLTESELVEYLRIPAVSKAADYRNVISNLKRFHDLPRIHICGRPLYPRKAIDLWIEAKTVNGK